jgi:hypothetical protein
MITCQLQGGIGNQLFQIAATYALALKNNDTCIFNFMNCNTPLQGNPSGKYKNNILKNVVENLDFEPRVYFREESFSYQELPYAEGLCLIGYFQSEKYFIDYNDEIKKLFSISFNDVRTIREFFNFWGCLDKPITSVHVRRGDYLKNSEFHEPCSIEYYQKAMQEIGDSYFIFISDDMDWVKENFKGTNIIYSTLNDEILDFTLMTQCDNNIIANSSFSWWGAYLNKNNNTVIAPKKWFGPSGPKDSQDIIPEYWVKI